MQQIGDPLNIAFVLLQHDMVSEEKALAKHGRKTQQKTEFR